MWYMVLKYHGPILNSPTAGGGGKFQPRRYAVRSVLGYEIYYGGGTTEVPQKEGFQYWSLRKPDQLSTSDWEGMDL